MKIKRLPAGCFRFLILLFLIGCRDEGDAVFQGHTEDDFIPVLDHQQLTEYTLNDICYQDRIGYVAVGDYGHILLSENGQKWRHIKATTYSLKSICSTAEGFVAVGDAGTILFSKNGEHWEHVADRITKANLMSVYGTEYGYAAAGDSGTILFSSKGLKWESKNTGKKNVLLNDVFGCNLGYVAVGDANTVLYSENGELWAAANIAPSEKSLLSVSGNSNGFVATGEGGSIFYSRQGNSWENISLQNADSRIFNVLGTASGLFVATGSGGLLLYSADGRNNWKKAAIQGSDYTNSNFLSVAASPSCFITVTADGDIYYSANGQSWQKKYQLDQSKNMKAVSCSGSEFVAVGESTSISYSSEDGQRWNDTSINKFDEIITDVFGNQKGFAAVGYNGQIIYSSDGIDWAIKSKGITTQNLNALSGGETEFIAVGDSGTILYSEEGIHWKITERGLTKNNLHAITNRDNKFVAVGDSATILYSSDGKTWNRNSEPLPVNHRSEFFAITHNSKYFVAVTRNNSILYSEDGISWHKPDIDEKKLNDISLVWEAGNKFYILNTSGEIWYSENGKNWEKSKRLSTDGTGSSPVICKYNKGFILFTLENKGDQHSGDIDYMVFQYSTTGEYWNANNSEYSYENNNENREWFIPHYSGLYMFPKRKIGLTDNKIFQIMEDRQFYPLLDSIKLTRYKKDSLSIEVTLRTKNKEFNGDSAGIQFLLEGITKTRKEGIKPYDKLAETNSFFQPSKLNQPNIWKANFGCKTLGFQPETKNLEKFYLSLAITSNNLIQKFDLKDYAADYFTLGKTPFQQFWSKFGKWILIIGAYYLFFLVLWLFFPLLILQIHEKTPFKDLVSSLPPPFNAILGFLNIFFPVSLLAHGNRCLNAWTKKNLPVLKTRFLQSETVSSKKGYIPLPVRLDDKITGELIEKPSSILLKKIFSKKRTITQLIGSGGSGKTSFVCETGRWLLDDENVKLTGGVSRIPFLVEEETKDIVKLLTEYFTAWLQKSIKPELIVALLKKQRIVLLVDALSEMNQEVIQYVTNIHGSTPANALLVTGRNEFDFRTQDSLLVYPQPLDSKNLLHFITSILQRLEDHPLPKLEDQLAFAQKIAQIFKSGDKDLPVTPILVRIVVDNLIENYSTGVKNTGELIEKIPATIPQVYFDYLKIINPANPSVKNYLPEEQMLKIVTMMGKLSLGDSFVPHDFKLDEARTEIQKILPGLNTDPVQRLIDNNILTKKTSLDDYFLRFNLDPLAEYAGATWYAKQCENKEGLQVFIEEVITRLDDNAKGFKMAFWLITNPGSQYDKIFGWDY